MTVPFGPTSADRALLDRVAALAEGFAVDAAGYDERAEIPVANLDALRDAGVTRAILPAALGGDGIQTLHECHRPIRLQPEQQRSQRRAHDARAYQHDVCGRGSG